MSQNSATGDTPITSRQKVALLMFGVLLGITVLELGIRAHDAKRGYAFFSNRRNQISQEFHSVIPFRMFGFDLYQQVNGNTYISSRHGELYPLEKPAGTIRLICFGGSTTQNLAARYGVHYPLALQLKLREELGRDDIEVISLGNSAYSTPHSLNLLALHVLRWTPDFVILSHNINDLNAAYWPNFTFDYSHKYAHSFYLPDVRGRYTPLNHVFQYSQFYWFAKDRLSKYFASFPPIQRRSYGPDPPVEAARTFERNLRTFVAVGTSFGVQVVLGTQPLEPSEEFFARHMAAKPYNDVVTYPLQEEFVLHHNRYNDIIRKVASDTEAWLVDNTPGLSGRTEFFIDAFHYTENGIYALANSYSEALLSKGIGTGTPSHTTLN